MELTSLAEKAYQEIRRKIIFAEFLPGEVLSENGLSKELEMSRTPIRDALLRLDSEGFVVTLKNRGILVKEVSYREIFEIMSMNHCMYVYAAELVSKGLASFDIEKLQLYLEKQLQAEEEDNYIKYTQNLILFGRTLIETTNNLIMLQTYDSLRDKTLRTAIVGWKLKPKDKHYSANQLHSDLYEVIVAKEYGKMKPILDNYYLQNRERFITMGGL